MIDDSVVNMSCDDDSQGVSKFVEIVGQLIVVCGMNPPNFMEVG